MDNEALHTEAALSLAGVNKEFFENAVGRRLYSEAPPVMGGATRMFDVDDITALSLIDGLLRLGLRSSNAAQIASIVRVELRRGDPERLWVVATAHDELWRVVRSRPKPGMLKYEIPIRAIRAMVQEAVSKFVAEQSKSA